MRERGGEGDRESYVTTKEFPEVADKKKTGIEEGVIDRKTD